mgnify:CR=1 FL=1
MDTGKYYEDISLDLILGKKQIPPSAISLNGIECFLNEFNSLVRFWKSKFDFLFREFS